MGSSLAVNKEQPLNGIMCLCHDENHVDSESTEENRTEVYQLIVPNLSSMDH